MDRMVEILRARRYYGPHATGVVVLVNGHPNHFTGKGASKEAGEWVEVLKERGPCKVVDNRKW